VQFEWDPEKALTNRRKHRVSFEMASESFFDPFAVNEIDRVEYGEYRWLNIGMVRGSILLVVANVPRDTHGEEIVRIISARKAEPHERRRNEQAR